MTKHGTAFGLALEAAQNAELALNNKDLEFFLCVIIDGDNTTAEMGGNVTPQVIKGLEKMLTELKIKNNTTALYSYSTEIQPALTEVESGIIR
ncbi:hypothetical protein DKL61_09165 [Gammaproteobacteria bacterium ESL0073]|nr:hypothetical protein DKL61_09165 [Gammaproteobacteria bacterium ESL0073]